jgi:hypothetical protein
LEENKLSRPNIKEQILELEAATDKFPKYLGLLNLSRGILEILLPLDELPTKGARSALSDDALKELTEKAISSKKPIIKFIEASFFDEETVGRFVGEIAAHLIDNLPDKAPVQRFLSALNKEALNVREAIEAMMKEDAEWYQEIGESYGIEPSLVLFMFETPLRPFFEDVARRVEGELVETWWEPFCPVCGRTTPVARIRGRKRYMTCKYCGAEHLVDLFLCVNCGNKEPYSLGFINFEEQSEYELNYCEKCNHYIKTIHEERLKRKIPKGLEDLLTQELDLLAEGHELDLERT